jgi:hypothetical protein
VQTAEELVLSDNWLGPELKHVTKHLDRQGSSLNIETFAIFNITGVLPNIWAEQSASTSLMTYGDERQNIVTTIFVDARQTK